jgi:hopanoid-associated phosphorylase
VSEAARSPVVAVAGLAREARIAAGPGVTVIACGGDAQRLAGALERELARGARAVISFGIAGGLVDDLAAGALLVGHAIVASGRQWPCDALWEALLLERLPGAIAVVLAGADAPINEPDAKRALQRATGAAAVDTESHIAAEIAARHELPFAAFRVVADGARQALPPAAAVALAPDGRIRRSAVLGSVARAPRQIPTLLRTAADARRAFRALSRGRRLLGSALAYPDLGERLLDVT